MKTWVRKTLSVGVLAAGALLFAPGGAAHADARQSNGDNNGILNGTQLVTGVQVPVNIVGNSLGILGEANSFGAAANRIEGARVGQSNGDNNGIANGTQAYLPISVPLNIVGNSAAVLGEANSAGVGTNSVNSGRRTESAHTTEGWWGGNGGQSNGDNNGILNGTQVYAPISVPINACGNSLALLGGAYSQAICGNDVFGGTSEHRRHGHNESGHVTESGWQSNGDNNGIANGTQLYAPISLPINLAGNSAALLGEANSRALAGNQIESAQGGPRQINGDNNGILNGTQIAAPISLPTNICGNSLGLLGQASSVAGCSNDVFGEDDFIDGDHGDHGHHGHHGHGPIGDLGDHGTKGHHGHKGQNAGDNGNQDPGYLGDNGTKPATNGYGNGTKPATNGYGNGTEPATNDGYGATKPATNDPGYGGTKPVSTGSASSSKGGRDKSDTTESTPVSSLTDTVGGMGDNSGLGGLGLLNTLR